MGVIETEKSLAWSRNLSWEFLKATTFIGAGYGLTDYGMRTHFNLDERAPDAMEFLDNVALLGAGAVVMALLMWLGVRSVHNKYLDKHFEPS